MADKASRGLVIYGDGLMPLISPSHTHIHQLASRCTCGFLSLPHSPPSGLSVSDADGDDGDDDFWCDDVSVCDESREALIIASDLDREWQRRHNQFHTIGYRDGLTAGKEESAQVGFNIGFKQSVLVGYRWGLVRGVTSALSFLPDGMKEKLVEELDTREKLQDLYEPVHSVSTQDALSQFHADIVASQNKEEFGSSDPNENTPYEISTSSLLGRYIEEFESLKLGCSD